MVPIAAGIGGLRDDGRGAARNTKQPPDRSPDRERLGHLISHLIGHPIGIGSVVTRASSDRDRLGRHLIGICSGSARSSSGSARALLCSALLCSARLGSVVTRASSGSATRSGLALDLLGIGSVVR